MELPHIKAPALPLTRSLSRRANLRRAHHETARLSRIHAVPIDLALRCRWLLADVLDHPADRLLARPATMMNSGVDDDAPRAEQLGLQHADAARGIVLVHAQLVGDAL